MTLARRPARHTSRHLALAWLVFMLPLAGWCHAFDDRYDLPAPLSYFVIGATLAVALSFVVAVLFVRRAPAATPIRQLALGPVLPILRRLGRWIALGLFVLTLAAGWLGTGDPMMNLAPTMVWIVWWLGLSVSVVCIGNIWPALDPWRTLFDSLDRLLQKLGRPQGAVLGLPYPAWLGAWPAVALLLSFAWLEMVYPQAAVPYRLASIALGWTVVTLLGMVSFGPALWQRTGDVFALYFETLGRCAPLAAGSDPRSMVLRSPGSGLLAANTQSAAMVGFVIAMLSTVLFDGLLGGQSWWTLVGWMARTTPLLGEQHSGWVGTAGLLGVWLLFLGGYLVSCGVAAWSLGDRPVGALAQTFAPSLVPIAVGYLIAHNLSALLVQGQQLIPLLSDPLGLKWDLLGTAGFRANIGIIDARLSWYIAVGAIVTGHVVSIWTAHRLALRACGQPRRVALATVPLTLLMLLYTAISLSVIAEPMVKFDSPDAVASRSAPGWVAEMNGG